jgi:hypothetical protein
MNLPYAINTGLVVAGVAAGGALWHHSNYSDVLSGPNNELRPSRIEIPKEIGRPEDPNAGKAAEKAAQDVGKTLEKASRDTGNTVENAGRDPAAAEKVPAARTASAAPAGPQADKTIIALTEVLTAMVKGQYGAAS